jgi:hypothetical protein
LGHHSADILKAARFPQRCNFKASQALVPAKFPVFTRGKRSFSKSSSKKGPFFLVDLDAPIDDLPAGALLAQQIIITILAS